MLLIITPYNLYLFAWFAKVLTRETSLQLRLRAG